MADYSGFDIATVDTDFVFPQGTSGFIVNIGEPAARPIYRGKLGGEYVYSVGSVPIGASDIIIVGYT